MKLDDSDVVSSEERRAELGLVLERLGEVGARDRTYLRQQGSQQSCKRTVRLRETVDVRYLDPDRLESLDERSGRRSASDARRDGSSRGLKMPLERRGQLVVLDRDLDRRCTAIVRDASEHQVERLVVVADGAHADLSRHHHRVGVGEAPAETVEHGEDPQILTRVRELGLDRICDGGQVRSPI